MVWKLRVLGWGIALGLATGPALAQIIPDKGPWAAGIPLYLALELEGVSIHVLHDVKEIDLLRRQCQVTDPAAARFPVVVSGHSHKPMVSERDGVTFVNPGSAGPRRFTLPISVGYLDITTGGPRARIIEIL